MELDLHYWNQNVRGRQELRKGQTLILCTVGKLLCDSHETLQNNSVLELDIGTLNRGDECATSKKIWLLKPADCRGIILSTY